MRDVEVERGGAGESGGRGGGPGERKKIITTRRRDFRRTARIADLALSSLSSEAISAYFAKRAKNETRWTRVEIRVAERTSVATEHNFIIRVESGYINYHLHSAAAFCSHFGSGSGCNTPVGYEVIHAKWNVNDTSE